MKASFGTIFLSFQILIAILIFSFQLVFLDSLALTTKILTSPISPLSEFEQIELLKDSMDIMETYFPDTSTKE